MNEKEGEERERVSMLLFEERQRRERNGRQTEARTMSNSMSS